MRLFALALMSVLAAPALPPPAVAEESPLKSLQTGDDSRGWEAVGRLNLGDKGFCTGALIAPDLVLTAAHCLFDKDSGARMNVSEIEFLAGWRNGRAEAYRHVRRAVAHPDYVYGGLDNLDRVAFDIALLELDQPIRMTAVNPFAIGPRPVKGDAVGVVSYGQDRAEAPSLQQVCHMLGRQAQVNVLSCSVDFGSSGAPVFALRDGVSEIVSVVSAKAEVDGVKVALGASLEAALPVLRDELAAAALSGRSGVAQVRTLSGGTASGAKFVKPKP